MEVEEFQAEVVVGGDQFLHCLILGKRVDIPPFLLQPGSTVTRSGDRGILVIPRWLAIGLALV